MKIRRGTTLFPRSTLLSCFLLTLSLAPRRILQAGKEAGLLLNFHGDEINYMSAGELGGELEALSISHLERVSDEGIAAMAKKPTFAVLLPTTAYILRLEHPPARKMIEAGRASRSLQSLLVCV